MEMIPNYVGEIPLIGPSLSDFLINTFTLNRTLVVHILHSACHHASADGPFIPLPGL